MSLARNVYADAVKRFGYERAFTKSDFSFFDVTSTRIGSSLSYLKYKGALSHLGGVISGQQQREYKCVDGYIFPPQRNRRRCRDQSIKEVPNEHEVVGLRIQEYLNLGVILPSGN